MGTGINHFWEQIQTAMEPGLKAWKSAWDEIESAVTSAWITVSASATNLWNGSISPLMGRVVNEFLPNVFNSLSEAFAPILGGVGSTGITIAAENFEWYCQEVQKQIDSSLVPALESIVKIYNDISLGIQTGWDTYGKPILEEITDFFSSVRSIVTNLWDTILNPIISNALEKINQLWDEHLKPLWDNLVLLFGSVSEYILTGWNNVLLPFLNWIIDVFGPLFTEKIERTQLVITTVFGAISDAINPFIVGFQGILDFMTNVFEGDWEGAWDDVSSTVTNVWDAIEESIKNKINAVIDLINSMIAGMVSGLNAVIRAMNTLSFDVPDWVPVVGGNHFGIDIKEITPTEIPRLAQGAVIPPNREFLAVLGDQRSGTNIEAPLDTIKQAVAEVMAGMGSGNNYTVNATANGRVLFQVMISEAENVMAQTGRNPFNLC